MTVIGEAVFFPQFFAVDVNTFLGRYNIWCFVT